MGQYRRPGRAKARAFLVNRGLGDGVRRLTISRAAASAGVSYVTMWKAASELRAQGLLDQWDEKLFAEPHAARSSARVRSWEHVHRSIQRDILRGEYQAGARLPPLKQLTGTYGVCHATLRRAVEAAVAGGAIVRIGRGYRVAHHSATGTGTVALVARRDPDHWTRLQVLSSRTVDHFRLLEHRCARANVNLVNTPFVYRGNDIRLAPARTTGRRAYRASLLGTIVWTVGMPPQRAWRIIDQLAAIGKPVAALEEQRGRLPPATRHDTRRIGIVSMVDSVAAGESVGRFLFGLGHRRVAYISEHHQTSWSQQRLEGLKRAFELAGFPDAVVAFVSHQDGPPYDPRSPGDWAQGHLHSLLDTAAKQTRHENSVCARAAETIIGRLGETVRGEVQRGTVAALARAASAPPSRFTAWVGANDNTACACIDYARRRGMHVPRDMSVIGFDDTMEAFAYNLTSFNFNGAAAMDALLEFVLAPRGGLKRQGEPTAIEGFLVARESSGRTK